MRSEVDFQIVFDLPILRLIIGLLLGLAGVILCIEWAKKVISQIDSGRSVPRTATAFVIVVGSLSGLVISNSPGVESWNLLVTSLLLAVQTPIDLATHRLARWPTLVSYLCLVLIQVVMHSDHDWWSRFWLPVCIAGATTFALATLHVTARSQLGFGDVLLSLPLGLAVALADLRHLLWWLLLSTATGAAHGLISHKNGAHSLPFGPHLLFSAWLVLFINV